MNSKPRLTGIARLAAGLRRNRTAAVFANLIVLSVTTNLLVFLVAAMMDVRLSSLWFMCLSASSMLFVADRGISYAMSRLIARHRIGKGPADIGATGTLVLRLFLTRAALPFTVLALALGAYIYFARHQSSEASETLLTIAGLWALVCAYMFLAVLSKYLQMTNEGLGKLADERYIVAICQIVATIAAAGALLVARQLWVIPVALLLGYAVQTLWLYRNMGPAAVEPGTTITAATLDEITYESRKLWHLNILVLISQNVQIMSLAFFASPASIAAFFFMQRLNSGAANVVGMIPIIDRGNITHHLSRGDAAHALAIIRRNLTLVILATLGCVVLLAGIVLLCNYFELVKFRIPGLLLALFCVDLAFAGILGALGQYVLASGENRFLPWVAACSVLTVALQFVLVPRFGAEGAIAAFVVAQSATVYVANIRYMVLAVRRMRSDIRRAERGAAGQSQLGDEFC